LISASNQKSSALSSKAADSIKDTINISDDTEESKRKSDDEEEQESNESVAETDNNSKNHKSK
jgi:hypothetical protein